MTDPVGPRSLVSLKFKDFPTICQQLRSKPPTATVSAISDVKKEKIKASVRWLHHADRKWVLSISKMEAQGNLKKQFTDVKLLLIRNTTANGKLYHSIQKSTKEWTIESLDVADSTVYTCLEGEPTSTQTPYILSPEIEENVSCIGIGLYTESKTKRKRYTIEISEMLLFTKETETLYNMKNITFQGDYHPDLA